jgi:hypothetical protein
MLNKGHEVRRNLEKQRIFKASADFMFLEKYRNLS